MAAFAATGATDAELAAFKATLDLRDEIQQAKELKETLEGVRDSLISMGASAALSGLEELGRALGEGEDATESMNRALVKAVAVDVSASGAAAYRPGPMAAGARFRSRRGIHRDYRGLRGRREQTRAGRRG